MLFSCKAGPVSVSSSSLSLSNDVGSIMDGLTSKTPILEEPISKRPTLETPTSEGPILAGPTFEGPISSMPYTYIYRIFLLLKLKHEKFPRTKIVELVMCFTNLHLGAPKRPEDMNNLLCLDMIGYKHHNQNSYQ